MKYTLKLARLSSKEIEILKELKFRLTDVTALGFSVMTLEHWVFQLWTYDMEVSGGIR